MLDGEYKVMGVAPYGDPDRLDLSRLVNFDGNELNVNTKFVNIIGPRRYKGASKSCYFSQKLVDGLRPRQQGDIADDTFVHYAASLESWSRGVSPEPTEHVHLGPSYTTQEGIDACESHGGKPVYQRHNGIVSQAAALLDAGKPVAWCQERMAFRPRTFGGRSILGNPGFEDVADKINAQIKFRERGDLLAPVCSIR